MKIVLLGTGGYFPTKQRHTACVMLPEVGVVLDAGTGMCQIGKYLQTDHLNIFLTHAHLDHIVGLTYLIVHGDSEKLSAVREHLFAAPVFPVSPAFKFQSLCGPCQLPQGGTLTYFPLVHPGGSLGYRLDWPGHSLAYVTDTTASPDASYLEAIRGVDLLLHEAYFADDSNNFPTITGHSALDSVAALAAVAKPRRLVIVHIDPTRDEEPPFDLIAARGAFSQIDIGRDDDEIDF
jgi:ribonuclease BN (tRNA processing enzyme)